MIVIYNFDSKKILLGKLNNRSEVTIKNSWSLINGTLSNGGVMPKIYILDNESSLGLKAETTKKSIISQSLHTSTAEMLLNFPSEPGKTFFSGLERTDPKFPASEWDSIIPQAILILNILRNSRVNPKLPAHTYLHGNFYFNATPLAPPGTIVLIHSKSIQQKTWSPHGEYGL